VSRSAFYAHFKDKYDLLDVWLKKLKKEYVGDRCDDERKLLFVVRALHENVKVAANLIKDHDPELIALLSDFLSSSLDATAAAREKNGRPVNQRHAVLSKFYAGGLLNVFLAEVRGRLLSENQTTIPYVFKMLRSFFEWDASLDA
jgi:AcrR family transcriptional regulator